MALSPEQKMQIITELQNRKDTTPEQKKRLGVLWTKQLAKQDQPIENISMTPVTKPDLEQQAVEMAESKFGQEHPYLTAAAGTVLSEAPEMIMGGIGQKPARKAATVLADEAMSMGEALIPGRADQVGKAIGKLDDLVGISKEIPTVANTAKRLGLPPQERSFSDIINVMAKKIRNKEKIDVQTLSNVKDLIAQQFKLQKIAPGTRAESIITETGNAVGTELNSQIAGRGKLAARYAKIKTIQKILKQATVGAAGSGAILYALNSVKGLLK